MALGEAASTPLGSDRVGRPIGLAVPLAVSGMVSIALATAPLLGLGCETCSGGSLAMLLPWAGVVVYGILVVACWRSPVRPWILPVMGGLVFAHAELQAESLALGRLCWACIIAALGAFAAAARIAWQRPSERIPLGTALVLGALASIFSPFERVDDWMTRTLFPARILESLPSFVDREELLRCAHGTRARLHVYEKDCKT